MSRGVFLELVENKFKKSEFDKFLSENKISNNNNQDEDIVEKNYAILLLQQATTEYESLLKKNSELFNRLAELEVAMIQSRCILSPNLKLSIVNQKRGSSETNYIVARSPYINPEISKKEIRVYLGKTDELGNDLSALSNNQEFMEKAKRHIMNAMSNISAPYQVLKKEMEGLK